MSEFLRTVPDGSSPTVSVASRIWWLAGVLVWWAGCSHEVEDRAARAREWANKVAEDKQKLAVVVSTGTAPRRAIEPPMAPGQVLDADVESEQTITITSDYAAPSTRHVTISAGVRLRARVPVGDEPPIELEITRLAGDLRDLERLPRRARIDPGAHGEPWMFVLDRRDGASGLAIEAEMLWGRDVESWARGILVPIPATPLGVGAKWSRTWTDYMGSASSTEACVYELVELDGTIAHVRGSASGGSQSKSIGRLEISIGPRAVPVATWSAHGKAVIVENGRSTTIETTGSIQIRPHDASALALPSTPAANRPN